MNNFSLIFSFFMAKQLDCKQTVDARHSFSLTSENKARILNLSH